MPKNDQLISIEGRHLALSNLEKLLYPGGRFTKAKVIDYYVRIADYLLPHLKDRPVTLKRFPEGVYGQFFYEKDAPAFTPEWVKTFPVPRREKKGPDIRYILINDLPTLVWLANLANLEIHPFLHRVPKIDRPTSIVFDCDPGEGADILDCARVAFMLKVVLDELGLESFAKVSGSKGIQVHVPLNSPVSYDVTQPFAKALAELLHQQHPNLIVSQMPKAFRAKKVFIDWSQNTDFKTTVSVYSLRAKIHKPHVSAPVEWGELDHALKKENSELLFFSPDEALARVKQKGDLFQSVLTKVQKLPRDVLKYLMNAPSSARSNSASLETYVSKRNFSRTLSNLPKAKLRFIQPMLAKPVSTLPEENGWRYEAKLDGYRALVMKENRDVTIFSRRGNNMNLQFPTVARAFAFLSANTILDGEIVALDDKGLPSFAALQKNRMRNLRAYFYAFDVLVYDGRDVRKLPLDERRSILENHALAELRDPVRISPILDAPARAIINAVKEQGLEGIVAKRVDSIYESGERTGSWSKYKTNQSQEFVIGGYKPGPNEFDYLLAGYYEGDDLIFVAKIKNGFVPALRREVAKHFKGLKTKVCPFANLPEPKSARRGEALTAEVMKKCVWLKPRLVAQIEFTEWTEGNHLRHSKFVGLRDDKVPRDARKESGF
jgi:bifunctional non-homologous end joining protein LigD